MTAYLDLRSAKGRVLLGHPALSTRGKRLGRGAFCVVYENRLPAGTIFKLIGDRNQYDFYRLAKSPVFPKVLADHGEIGEGVFLLGMERLTPIRHNTEASRFVRSFVAQFAHCYPAHGAEISNTVCSAEALVSLAERGTTSLEFRQGLLEIAEFILSRHCDADFHRENFMLRENGQVVMNDPVATPRGHT